MHEMSPILLLAVPVGDGSLRPTIVGPGRAWLCQPEIRTRAASAKWGEAKPSP